MLNVNSSQANVIDWNYSTADLKVKVCEKDKTLTSYTTEFPFFGCKRNFLLFSKLTVLLHDGQELNDDLGRRTDENLSLTTAFGVVDVVQTIVQDGDSDHVI
jgi:hypothetical protein